MSFNPNDGPLEYKPAGDGWVKKTEWSTSDNPFHQAVTDRDGFVKDTEEWGL